MFCLNIALGSTSWRLLYKDAEKAAQALEVLSGTLADSAGVAILHDDFGQTLVGRNFHGWMLEDLDATKMAHVEMALHQERTKLAAQKAATADPVIREALRQQNAGPAIFNPVGNGMRPPM